MVNLVGGGDGTSTSVGAADVPTHPHLTQNNSFRIFGLGLYYYIALSLIGNAQSQLFDSVLPTRVVVPLIPNILSCSGLVTRFAIHLSARDRNSQSC